MSIYALTLLQRPYIFDIWCYIAEHSEDAANRVGQAIYEACAFVAEAPLRSHSRRELTTRSLRVCQRPPPFRSSPFCTGREIYGIS
jgi:plasmid stabilization system protein ParE